MKFTWKRAEKNRATEKRKEKMRNPRIQSTTHRCRDFSFFCSFLCKELGFFFIEDEDEAKFCTFCSSDCILMFIFVLLLYTSTRVRFSLGTESFYYSAFYTLNPRKYEFFIIYSICF